MTENLFEVATRQKYRFASNKGELTTEQLWELPLKAKNGFDLDTVARSVYQDLKATSEESFVEVSQNPNKAVLEQKLEIVKHIIAVKQDERKKAEEKAANAAERKRLLEILAKRQDEELEGLSKEEIEQRIKELT